MNDFQIRNILVDDIRKKYRTTIQAKNLIVQEMVLCRGFARIDVALVNGSMHGFEIKSSEDTLARLKNQLEYYSQCFDYLTIVASEKHINNILTNYPLWLGISLASAEDAGLVIKKIRPARRNKNINTFSLMQLLWKSELLEIANLYSQKNISTLNKGKIIERLILNIREADLHKATRQQLKSRTTWAIAEAV